MFFYESSIKIFKKDFKERYLQTTLTSFKNVLKYGVVRKNEKRAAL